MLANKSASDEAESAREKVLADQTARQNGYDAQAFGLSDQSRNRYSDFAGQQTSRANALSDYFKNNSSSVTDLAGGNAATDANAAASSSPSSDNLVVKDTAAQLAKAADYNDQQNDSLAKLRSFGDVLGSIGRGQNQDATQIAEIGGFKKGMASVMPYQLQDAAQKGSGLKTFGDLLGLGGAAMMMGGSAALGSGASGSGGLGSWAQDYFGNEPGSFGRWLAGNGGVDYGTAFGPGVP